MNKFIKIAKITSKQISKNVKKKKSNNFILISNDINKKNKFNYKYIEEETKEINRLALVSAEHAFRN